MGWIDNDLSRLGKYYKLASEVIKIDPMSGKSNVVWFLEKHGIAPTDKAVDAVLALAKTTPRLLTDAEIVAAARA